MTTSASTSSFSKVLLGPSFSDVTTCFTPSLQHINTAHSPAAMSVSQAWRSHHAACSCQWFKHPEPQAYVNVTTICEAHLSSQGPSPRPPDTQPSSSPGLKSMALGVGAVWPLGKILISGMVSRAYLGGKPSDHQHNQSGMVHSAFRTRPCYGANSAGVTSGPLGRR